VGLNSYFSLLFGLHRAEESQSKMELSQKEKEDLKIQVEEMVLAKTGHEEERDSLQKSLMKEKSAVNELNKSLEEKRQSEEALQTELHDLRESLKASQELIARLEREKIERERAESKINEESMAKKNVDEVNANLLKSRAEEAEKKLVDLEIEAKVSKSFPQVSYGKYKLICFGGVLLDSILFVGHEGVYKCFFSVKALTAVASFRS